jgi:signal peptidase I
MEPAIPIGAAVILEQVDPAALAVNDVVSLRSGPGRAVFTHRIVRIVEREDGRWIETKGDANPGSDPSVTPVSAVIGRATLMVPSGGYLLALLSEPAGVLLVLSSGATLMVLGWLFESFEIDRRRRRAPATASIRSVDIVPGVVAMPAVVAAAMPARTAVAMTADARVPAPTVPAVVAAAMPARTAVAMAAARTAQVPASAPATPATLASVMADPTLVVTTRTPRATRPRRPKGAGRVTPDTVESERRRLARLRTAGRGA